MSIRKMFVTVYTVGSIAIVGLMVMTGLMIWNQLALKSSQEVRFESYLLADELRQSSDDLTNLARTYVVTGDARYEQQYWHVLAVRNGEKPRPDGRKVALQTLMKDLGFSEQEFAKLRESEASSNSLVRTETVAMNAVKGRFDDGAGQFTRTGEPDFELARRVMFDGKYHDDKAIIMRPIDEFARLLDERTRADVERLETRGRVYLGIIALLVLCAAGVSVVMVRALNRVLGQAVRALVDGNERLLASSEHVSSSAQALSQGATEQAASLEETSASMEEMASMTRKNAENSRAAAGLMSQVDARVHASTEALDAMVTSMSAIRESSGKVAKIIKTIDEIAFQTNILALNAAVEAARAGDAGMGFAVVAGEVRNLAQRSSQAARDTAVLIEDAIAKSQDGTERVQVVATSVSEITASVLQVRGLVEEVSLASEQQSQGIDQVSQAVAQMEKVTQTTAATAEESAASAEELQSQAASSADVVSRLQALVGGAVADGRPRVQSVRSAPARPVHRPAPVPAPAMVVVPRAPQAEEHRSTGTYGSF